MTTPEGSDSIVPGVAAALAVGVEDAEALGETAGVLAVGLEEEALAGLGAGGPAQPAVVKSRVRAATTRRCTP